MLQCLNHLNAIQYVHVSPGGHVGAQNWTKHARCGLPSAEQRGTIAFPDLLAMLFLTQPSVPLAFFCCEDTLMACVAHQDLKVLLGKATFHLTDPQHVLVHGVVLPQV